MHHLTLHKLHSFRAKKRLHIQQSLLRRPQQHLSPRKPLFLHIRLKLLRTQINHQITTPKHTQSTPPNETHNISLSPEQTSTNTTPLLRSDNTHQTTRDAPDRTKDPYHRLGKRNAGTGFNKIYLAFILIPLILLVIITFIACKKRSYVRVCRDDDNSIEMYEVSSESSEHDIYSADDL